MKKQPGVADNKSYKDMYHFNDSFYPDLTREDMPSLNVDPKINTTIKENPYRSNVEIEKDEIVLQPDLSALFRAMGKKHSGGGIDVLLKPDAFVFSDDKSLAFGERDHKLFEFKKGGNFKPDKNTPAEVLKRNIDIKHYNTLVSNILDIKKDDLAKKSSTLMLDKYIQTLGNIAFLQEAKKDFPQGVPDISDGTAPVYDSEVKDKVMEQKQYAKYGGIINNPYATGGVVPCPCGRGADGKCLPCSEDVYQGLLPKARKVKKALPGYEPLYTDPLGTQLLGKFGEDPRTAVVPRAIPGGAAAEPWRKKIQALINSGATVDDLVKQKHGTREGLLKLFKFGVPGTPDDYIRLDPEANPPVEPPGHSWEDAPYTATPPVPPVTRINPNEPTAPVDGGKEIDWRFSPWQRVSQAYNLAKLASAKRYMPYRSHMNASYIDPALVNPEQVVGDMKGAFNQNLAATNSLSPILRNAQAQSSYGQMLSQIPGVRSQYDNQNVGIQNQARQYNNQIRNNTTAQNMQNDQNYYRETVVANQNYDNLKSFLGDQYMNNLMGDVQDNQALAYTMATMRNPAYSYDFRTGNFSRNSKSILDVDNASNTQENLIDLAKSLKQQGFTDKLIGDIIKSKTFQTWNPTQKKGGKIGKNPYKK